MVAYSVVKTTNNLLHSRTEEGYTALFTGATSGIGEATLKSLASHLNGLKIKFYVVGRSETAAAPIMADLKKRCPDGTFVFVEEDISVLKNVDKVAADIKTKEKKLDLLWCSAGFLNFTGARQETADGLDTSISLRYYTRMRLLQQLLPLLTAAKSGRVVSCLAAGAEGKLKEDDLDLKNPANFGLINSAIHTATMTTLVMDVWAEQNPKVTFVHYYPGVVLTNNYSRGHSGWLGWFIQNVVPVLAWPFSIGIEESGERGVYYATSATYQAGGPLKDGVERVRTTRGGAYALLQNNEPAKNEKIIEDYHKRSVDAAVIKFTQDKFDALCK